MGRDYQNLPDCFGCAWRHHHSNRNSSAHRKRESNPWGSTAEMSGGIGSNWEVYTDIALALKARTLATSTRQIRRQWNRGEKRRRGFHHDQTGYSSTLALCPERCKARDTRAKTASCSELPSRRLGMSIVSGSSCPTNLAIVLTAFSCSLGFRRSSVPSRSPRKRRFALLIPSTSAALWASAARRAASSEGVMA